MQTGPVGVSEQVANGWQKFCREQIPFVTSEGVARIQYRPSPCHPAGHDPQRCEP